MIVGSKNFTEQVLLGELLAQTIERRTGLARRTPLESWRHGDCAPGAASGGIDAYVEYSGTALTAIFNLPASTRLRMRCSRQIRDRYASVGITALPRLGFNNTFAILVRGATRSGSG